jgi:hypothetical protein
MDFMDIYERRYENNYCVRKCLENIIRLMLTSYDFHQFSEKFSHFNVKHLERAIIWKLFNFQRGLPRGINSFFLSLSQNFS